MSIRVRSLVLVLVLVRVALVALVCAALAGCELLAKPGWLGDGLHVAGGYWMLTEEPCTAPLAGWCEPAVELVERTLGEDAAAVASVAVARTPGGYRAEDGTSILMTTGGWVESLFVIAELRDGRRAVLGAACEPDMTDDAGRVRSAARCWPEELAMYRVDAPFPPDLTGD